MGINLGSTSISDLKLGSEQVNKVYKGSDLIWQKQAPVQVKALRFTSAGSQTLGIDTTKLGTVTPSFEYSTDNGNTWTAWTVSRPISFGNGTDLYLRGSNTVLAKGGVNYTNFVFSTNSPVNCSGNIMHLYDYTQDLTAFPSVSGSGSSRGVKFLFQNCTQLVTPPDLPAIALDVNGYTYYYMFAGCTSLITSPSLPATTTWASAYEGMFNGCTSLTKIPQLKANALVSMNAGYEMFKNCTSIKMSTTQEGEYINTYDFGGVSAQINNMFAGTGGTFTTGIPPQILYTANEIIE